MTEKSRDVWREFERLAKDHRERPKPIARQVECGLLSFSGCCHNNHRDCISDEQLRAEHTPLIQMGETFAKKRKYVLTSNLPFQIQGILLWEPSADCCINEIAVSNTQVLVSDGCPASMFISPIEMNLVVESCKSQHLPYILSSFNRRPIYMPTISPDVVLTMTITGDVYDLIFWGIRFLSSGSSSPSGRCPMSDARGPA